jgi:hypothetical protein
MQLMFETNRTPKKTIYHQIWDDCPLISIHNNCWTMSVAGKAKPVKLYLKGSAMYPLLEKYVSILPARITCTTNLRAEQIGTSVLFSPRMQISLLHSARSARILWQSRMESEIGSLGKENRLISTGKQQKIYAKRWQEMWILAFFDTAGIVRETNLSLNMLRKKRQRDLSR